MSGEIRVGLIGVGTMGKGLARNIGIKGFDLTVYDRSPDACAVAISHGARVAKSPAELAKNCDVILTCLPSVEAIRAVYFGEDGVIQCAPQGATLVDLSTGDPVIARDCAAKATARGLSFLDAPMLRNPEAAWNGTLHLIVGGEAEVLDRVRPVLAAVSERILHVGPTGAGQTLKLINNAVTISNTAILCEVYEVAKANAVNLELLTDALSSSMAASKVLPAVSKRLIDDDHQPLFATDVVKKDISLYTVLAEHSGRVSPIGDAVRDLVVMASALGFGADHYTRIATVLEQASKERGEVK